MSQLSGRHAARRQPPQEGVRARALGRSGLSVSAVGLGCLSISGFYGRVDADVADRVIGRALDLGVRLLDVADSYANGEGERRVGKAIRGRREQAVVATKVGQRYAADGTFLGVDGSPGYIRAACNASLRRLGIDAIDLLQLHRVDSRIPIEETVGAMSELVDQGKVRFLGLSEALPLDIRRAAATAPIAALQSEYSLLERSVEREVLPTCEELGIGFLAYAPLLRGVLSDRYVSTDELEPEDPRRAGRYPRTAGAALVTNRRLATAVREIAGTHGVAPAQVALAWLLTQRPWIVPLPGTRHVRYLEDNVAATRLQLDAHEVERLDRLVPVGGAGAGGRYQEGFVTDRVSAPPRVREKLQRTPDRTAQAPAAPPREPPHANA